MEIQLVEPWLDWNFVLVICVKSVHFGLVWTEFGLISAQNSQTNVDFVPPQVVGFHNIANLVFFDIATHKLPQKTTSSTTTLI